MRAVVVKRERGWVTQRLVIHDAGSVDRVTHYPWLYVFGVQWGEETSTDFLAFNQETWRYEKIGKARKVYLKDPRYVRPFLEEVEKRGGRHSFSNVRYEARLSMDYADEFLGIKVPVPLYYSPSDLESVLEELRDKVAAARLLAFDIEVASEQGRFPRPGDKVFIVSFSDGEDSWLLEGDQVCEYIKEVRRYNPWFLFGFNSAGFDIRYLRAYCGGDFDEQALWDTATPHIDLMEILDRHGAAFGLAEGKRYALDDAAEALGLATREELEIERGMDRGSIWEIYRRDPERVRRYASLDAVLTARLARYVYPVLAVLYVLTGIAPNVVQLLPTLGSLSEYATFEIVRRRHDEVYEVRSRRYGIRGIKDSNPVYTNKYKDMFTKPMYLENVVEYDFNMLYPSIYARYRLDPAGVETGKGFRVPLITETGNIIWLALYSRGGNVSEALNYFYYARKTTKKLKKKGWAAPDQAIKILANSAYGAFSKGRGMAVHEGLSAFIFFKANEIMHNLVNWLAARGNPVVYTATDSLFVLGVSDPTALEQEINKWLAEHYGPEFSVKTEAVIRRLALIKKKTYVFIDSEGNVTVKGMEKLALPRIVKDNLEEIFRAELEEGRGVAKLRELLRRADTRDLFVRTSKRFIDAVYSVEEHRWKTINNMGSRAVVLTALYQDGRAPPTDLALEEIGDYTVVAYWLGERSNLYLLIDGGVVKCTGIRIAGEGDKLSIRARCARVSPTRAFLEHLAYSRSKPVLEYISIIRSARGVARWKW